MCCANCRKGIIPEIIPIIFFPILRFQTGKKKLKNILGIIKQIVTSSGEATAIVNHVARSNIVKLRA